MWVPGKFNRPKLKLKTKNFFFTSIPRNNFKHAKSLKLTAQHFSLVKLINSKKKKTVFTFNHGSIKNLYFFENYGRTVFKLTEQKLVFFFQLLNLKQKQ